jgi:hypothetical protein
MATANRMTVTCRMPISPGNTTIAKVSGTRPAVVLEPVLTMNTIDAASTNNPIHLQPRRKR